jgi:hypothetical protein
MLEIIGDPVVRNFKDETVVPKTGKNWEEWYSVLDSWGAQQQPYTLTTRHLRETHGVSTFWATNITSRYQWARGLRAAK